MRKRGKRRKERKERKEKKKRKRRRRRKRRRSIAIQCRESGVEQKLRNIANIVSFEKRVLTWSIVCPSAPLNYVPTGTLSVALIWLLYSIRDHTY